MVVPCVFPGQVRSHVALGTDGRHRISLRVEKRGTDTQRRAGGRGRHPSDLCVCSVVSASSFSDAVPFSSACVDTLPAMLACGIRIAIVFVFVLVHVHACVVVYLLSELKRGKGTRDGTIIIIIIIISPDVQIVVSAGAGLTRCPC